MANFYITTTLPYINAKPHLGFAWEILTADFIARYQRLLGNSVIFNTGTDEHGQKVYQKAVAAGLSAQAYTDQLVNDFKALKELLDLSYTDFTRTTDKNHQAAAQTFWKKCLENGDIYKKKYQSKYCVGCELEKTDSELVEGHCPLHPQQTIEIREEENYFFRFSKYQEQLLYLYQTQPELILGQGKQKEIVSFVQGGLQDFSISRVKSKMPWGIPVPEDEEQVMYVWFDALINYISVLGWPINEKKFAEFWPAVQICGKDNLRQQAAMWQSMLISANLKTSKKILINGFITVNGEKMSKSLGNVIAPADLVDKFGREATRFIIAGFPVYREDVDITPTRLEDFYTANLVNGLGNLCSRLAKLASTVELAPLAAPESLSPNMAKACAAFQTSQALQTIIDGISELDQVLSREKPWLTTDTHAKAAQLQPLIAKLCQIAYDLQIFMPETSHIILTHFLREKIEPLAPLFPRLK
ncbi:MAG: methionine--tRNA ligase [bacterium]|nr:methionine--tRNA ligase [bacterium]